jgi:hypothetical protein
VITDPTPEQRAEWKRIVQSRTHDDITRAQAAIPSQDKRTRLPHRILFFIGDLRITGPADLEENVGTKLQSAQFSSNRVGFIRLYTSRVLRRDQFC